MADVSAVLKLHQNILSIKAQNFIKALQAQGISKEKRAKLVHAILYDVITEYKAQSDLSASEIILTCIKFLIENRKDVKDFKVLQLDLLIKEAFKRALEIEDDLEHVQCLMNCLIDLILMPNGCSSKISDWVAYKLQNSYKKNFLCKCPKVCNALKCFKLELMSLNIRSFSGSLAELDLIKNVILTAGKHMKLLNFSESHLKLVASECADFMSQHEIKIGKKLNPQFRTVIKIVENIVILDGKQSLLDEKIVENLENIESSISILMRLSKKSEKSYSGDTAKFYLNIFKCYLTILTNIEGKINGSLCTVVKCISKFSILTNETKSLDVMNKIISFYYSAFKTASPDCMSMILKDMNFLFERNTEILTPKSTKILDSIIYFLEVMVRICAAGVNYKGDEKFDLDVENITLKLFKLLSGLDFEENSKTVSLMTNVAIVLVKVQRKLFKNLSAMEIVEQTFQKVPYDVVKPLVNHWVKAKLIESNAMSKTSDHNVFKKRNIADGINKSVPRPFLEDILVLELELYELTRNTEIEQLSVASALLKNCNLPVKRKASLICKKLKLEHELFESDTFDFKSIYAVCKPEDETWESYVQIKVIEFAELWNKSIKTNQDKSLNVNVELLNQAVECCEKAVLKQFPLFMLEQTCIVVHKISAMLRLFCKPIMNIRIVKSALLLLDGQTSIQTDSAIFLWNRCSILCEIGYAYLALKQVKIAENHAELASRAFDVYLKCQSDDENDTTPRNLLFTKVKVLFTEISCAKADGVKAQEIIDKCMKEKFLQMEALQKSNTSLFCSVQVMSSNCDILISNSSELRISKLLSTSRRIASLKASIMPDLHAVQNKEVESAGNIFKGKNKGVHYDFYNQVRTISYFFDNLQKVSEAYLVMGDPKLANVYSETGLLYAKYLCLKNWYASFCLLKLKVSSLRQDDDNFPQLCKFFCQVCECDCTPVKNMIDDSILQCDTQDDDIAEGITEIQDMEREVVGSTDEDAIEFTTPAMDVDCYSTSTPDISASPAVLKRKKLNLLVMPRLLKPSKGKSCLCDSNTNLKWVEMQLDYANTLADYYLRYDALEESVEICKKILKSSFWLDSALSLIPLEDEIRTSEFYVSQVVTCYINSSYLSLKKSDYIKALENCNKAKEMLIESDYTDFNHILNKAKINFLCSNVNQTKSEVRDMAIDSKLLNALIDGLSKCKISPEVVEVHTPVMERSRRRVSTVKKTKPSTGSSRSTKGKSTKTKKNDASKEFKIFTEKNEKENTLPVPKYIHSRSPSPSGNKNVYDFMSSEDDKKTPAKKTLKSSQNIMQARKAATRRHRKQFGTIYSEEEKERVRGRVGKPSVARTKCKQSLQGVKQYLSEVPCIAQLNENVLTYLFEALTSADLVSDFLTMKLCAQAISACHYHAAMESHSALKVSKAAAFHLFSVGVSTRTAMQHYAKNITNTSCFSKSCGDICTCWRRVMEDASPMNALKSCLEDSDLYVSSITKLMPHEWTVSVISKSQSKNSDLLLTRLQHGRAAFHMQIDGNFMDEILEKFSDLMVRNATALKSRDKNYWWTQRRNFDAELKDIVDNMGTKSLGCYVGFLQGNLVDVKVGNKLSEVVNNIMEEFSISKYMSQHIEVLINSWQYLSIEQKLQGIISVAGSSVTEQNIAAMSNVLERTSKNLDLQNQARHHVILILDKDVQLLPWEVTTQLQGESVTRLPSTDLLKLQLYLLKSAENNVAKEGVNLKDVSYVLNPNADLIKSEERYKDWFQGMKSWKGIVSRAPLQKEWISSITDFDLFIFCGHGSGTKYVSSTDFRNIRTRAAALLMGCGSAKLDQSGVFEPAGIVVHYLMTGSPCVLGCLWKVTDKDIDMYLCKLLENWANGKKELLPRCTNNARKSLKMPHINGAACVIYGLPIHCQVTIAKFLKSIPKDFLTSKS